MRTPQFDTLCIVLGNSGISKIFENGQYFWKLNLKLRVQGVRFYAIPCLDTTSSQENIFQVSIDPGQYPVTNLSLTDSFRRGSFVIYFQNTL